MHYQASLTLFLPCPLMLLYAQELKNLRLSYMYRGVYTVWLKTLRVEKSDKNWRIKHFRKFDEQNFDELSYRIVQNGGGGKLWRINRFRVLARKMLANLIF